MHGVSTKNRNLTLGFEFLGVKRNAMARTYKPDPRGKKYVKHTPEAINSALADHRRGMSFQACSRKQGIPTAVLCRRARNPHIKPQGGQTVQRNLWPKESQVELLWTFHWIVLISVI